MCRPMLHIFHGVVCFIYLHLNPDRRYGDDADAAFSVQSSCFRQSKFTNRPRSRIFPDSIRSQVFSRGACCNREHSILRCDNIGQRYLRRRWMQYEIAADAYDHQNHRQYPIDNPELFTRFHIHPPRIPRLREPESPPDGFYSHSLCSQSFVHAPCRRRTKSADADCSAVSSPSGRW